MTIQSENLSMHVAVAVASNLGWDSDTPESIDPYLEKMSQMSAREVFDRYLTWIGIIGYTDRLIEVLDNIRACDTTQS